MGPFFFFFFFFFLVFPHLSSPFLCDSLIQTEIPKEPLNPKQTSQLGGRRGGGD